MRRLFLDLDGVMADFDAHFEALYGLHPAVYCDLHGDDAMWERIHSTGSFFRDLPPMPGALEAFERCLQFFDPTILTACPKSDYKGVAAQKHGWVREHLGPQWFVCPTAGGTSKPRFLQHPGDILIDDFERNTKLWEKAGGVAILHRGDWDETLAVLYRVLRDE